MGSIQKKKQLKGTGEDHDRDHRQKMKKKQNDQKKLMVKRARMIANLDKKVEEFKTLCGVEGCFIYLPDEFGNSDAAKTDLIQRSLPEKRSDVVGMLKNYLVSSAAGNKGKRKFIDFDDKEKPTNKKIKFGGDDDSYCQKQSSENCPDFSKEFERRLESGNLMLGNSLNPTDDDKKMKGKLIEYGSDVDDQTVLVNPSISSGFGHTDDIQTWGLSHYHDGASTSTSSYVMNDPFMVLGFDQTDDDQLFIVNDMPTISHGSHQMISFDDGEVMFDGVPESLNSNGNYSTNIEFPTESEGVIIQSNSFVSSSTVSGNCGFQNSMGMVNQDDDDELLQLLQLLDDDFVQLQPLDDDLHASVSNYFADECIYGDPKMYYSRANDDNDVDIATLLGQSDYHGDMGMIMNMITA